MGAAYFEKEIGFRTRFCPKPLSFLSTISKATSGMVAKDGKLADHSASVLMSPLE